MLIKLEAEHVAFADQVAIRRQAAAIERQRPAHNGAPEATPAALAIHILGARCEAAAKLYLNPIHWNAFHASVKNLPDLGEFIDVKGIAKPSHRLIVQKDDAAEWAYLLVNAFEHPLYTMEGWCWGRDAQHPAFWRDPVGGRAAYFVARDRLRPPHELVDIVRRRGAA